MTALIAYPLTRTGENTKQGLRGEVKVPGDKSISHRAVMLASLCEGESEIKGLLEGDDVMATAGAFRALGVPIKRVAEGHWLIKGVGLNGFRAPQKILDMGNSGTAMRLMMGVLAGQNFRSFLSGDESLNRRPMARVATPLQAMGAEIHCRSEKFPPLAIKGPAELLPIKWLLPVASAQVKSAIMLAALNASGVTEIIEPAPTRNHSEIMLARLGAQVEVEQLVAGDVDDPDGSLVRQGASRIKIGGRPKLRAGQFDVAGDFSSAAFPLVAGLIVPNSKLRLLGVGLNPTRTGLLTALQMMGAKLSIHNPRSLVGESVGEIDVESSQLKAVKLDPALAPLMIDEYPILAIAAAFANGVSRFEGLGELRVKESDRLAAIAAGLLACGVSCRMGEDWLEIDGCGPQGVKGGASQIITHHDHRIAMSFLVMGMASSDPITIDDDSMISTSFPSFVGLMQSLGAHLAKPDPSLTRQI